jgi:hypothetical protein
VQGRQVATKPESLSAAATSEGLRSGLASLLRVEELALGPSTLSLPARPLPLPACRRTPSCLRRTSSCAAGGAASPMRHAAHSHRTRGHTPPSSRSPTSPVAAFHGICICREKRKESERGREGEANFWTYRVSDGIGVRRLGTLSVGLGRGGSQPECSIPWRVGWPGCILYVKYTQVYYIHTIYIYVYICIIYIVYI